MNVLQSFYKAKKQYDRKLNQMEKKIKKKEKSLHKHLKENQTTPLAESG